MIGTNISNYQADCKFTAKGFIILYLVKFSKPIILAVIVLFLLFSVFKNILLQFKYYTKSKIKGGLIKNIFYMFFKLLTKNFHISYSLSSNNKLYFL